MNTHREQVSHTRQVEWPIEGRPRARNMRMIRSYGREAGLCVHMAEKKNCRFAARPWAYLKQPNSIIRHLRLSAYPQYPLSKGTPNRVLSARTFIGSPSNEQKKNVLATESTQVDSYHLSSNEFGA